MTTSNHTHTGKGLNSNLITFKSTRFSEISVPKESILEFPAGLFGFKNKKHFVALNYKQPFMWLHSIEDPNLAFIVIDTSVIQSTYRVEPPFPDTALNLDDGQDYSVLAIVTFGPFPEDATVNLRAPIIVDHNQKIAAQVVLESEKYSLKEALWPLL